MSQVGVVVVIPSSQMVDLSDHKPPVLCQLSLIDYLYLFEYTSCKLIIALALPEYWLMNYNTKSFDLIKEKQLFRKSGIP